MSPIKGFTNLRIDDMNVIVLTKSYVGSPLICYSPDMLIVPEGIFDKYSEEHFHIDYSKTKVVKI